MSASPSILGLGSSALNAYRSALAVTSNNISNVGVDGYSRQRADLTMNDAMQTYAGYMGNGVETAEISRTYDKFLTSNLNTASSSFGHYDTYHSYASTIDEIVADPEMGMTPAINSFFNSLQDLSTAPTSVPARQVVQGEGEALVSRFNTLHREMQTVRDQTLEEMSAIVEKINGISRSIADINIQIANASAGNTSHTKQPNELMDQRDLLVKEISEYIGVTTLDQEGMTSVMIGKGQSLVTGGSFNELDLGNSQYQAGDSLKLFMKMGKHNIDITSAIKGGAAGGIVDFTSEILNPAQNSLGRIAVTLSATFNAHQRGGFGLGGETDTGKNFFDMGQVTTSGGISSMALESAVGSSNSEAKLTVSIPMNNSEVTVGPVGADAVSGLALNGFLIQPSTAGATLVETAANIAEKINAESSKTNVTAEVVDGNKIKLISKEDIVVSMQPGGDIAATGLEEGTYRMIGSSIKSLTADDYALTFDGSNYTITNQMTKEVRVLTNDEAVQLKNPNMMGGVVHDGLTFQMNTYYGDMKEGELILVQPSRRAAQDISMEMTASEINSIAAADKVNEPGSNVNLLNMISLQTEKMMTAGANGLATTGLQDSYGQLIADIGVQTHYADINRTSQEAILRNAQSSRDNNAAVNLDEEAANLMKYQQMYQASTRIISMADELFKAVLNAV